MMEMTIELPQDDLDTPPALQRLWSRRMTVTASLPEESDLGVLEDLFPAAQVRTRNHCACVCVCACVRALYPTVRLVSSGGFFCPSLES